MTNTDIEKLLNDIRNICIDSKCEECPYTEIIENHDFICSIWKITKTYPDSWKEEKS